MARSYRTQPPSVTAEKKIAAVPESSAFPRIVIRSPAHDDFHPLNRQILMKLFKQVPVEFLYGLKLIEMRSRTSKEVGDPFAFYRRSDRAIVLYSVPRGRWPLRAVSRMLDTLERCGARIVPPDDVVWPDDRGIRCFFYSEVIPHELAHHYAAQYRIRRKKAADKFFREWQAEARAFALWWKLFGKGPIDR